MTVKVINRPENAREICLSVLKRSNLVYAGIVAFVAAVGLWFVLDRLDEQLSIMGVAFLVAAVVLIPLQAWKVSRVIKQLACVISQSSAQTPEQHITFDERIVSERRVGDEIVGKTVIEYSAIRKAWETNHLILIHTRFNQILALPKCDLTTAEQADVKRLLCAVGVPCRFKKAR